jgi:GT2 family glycosyltransferase
LQGDAPIDHPHHHDLELLAAQALARNDYARAFELSDRRCRIAPAPQPNSYLLRAESSFRMKREAYAIADLDKALDLAPDDAQANRRMLAWAKGGRKTKAARSLLTNAREADVLRKAIDALQHQGSTNFSSLTVLDERVEGWAVWGGTSAAEVSIVTPDNAVSFFIDADPFHILRSDGRNAASFSVARPKSTAPQSFVISVDGNPIFSLRAPGNINPPSVLSRVGGRGDEAIPTVIIPIYADFSATKACLNSVWKAMQSDTYEVLLVSDAPPDGSITQYLDAFVQRTGIEMLVNSSNMGFVGSINRALQAVESGDVILLNSDTIVPPGFVTRLAAAAHSSADIGTVVPLTNNGEFSSFPIANDVNELGSYDDIVALDRVAALVNRTGPVDIPSGIGFCLYITRACLNAVGCLSEHYQRGYLEDVDLCLRARELGFRSVCAPSVYVGHEGSRSFKSEKRSLVVRNLQVLDEKFPRYRNECSAFVAIDPLRPAREAIERSLPLDGESPRVIVAGTGAVHAIAQARNRASLTQGSPAILLEVSQGRAGPVVRPVGPDRIVREQTPYDIFIADSGLFYPPQQSPRVRKASPNGLRDTGSTEDALLTTRLWQRHWQTIAEGAEHVFVPCPMARAFASRHLTNVRLSAADEIESDHQPASRHRGKRLGILVFRPTADEFEMIHSVSQAVLDRRPELNIVIIGSTMDDQRLMKRPNIHVTGFVASDEFDRVVDQYDLGALLIGSGVPLFGHPFEQAAVASGLPTARFDWSDGQYNTQGADLIIAPNSDPTDIAALLLRWMKRR